MKRIILLLTLFFVLFAGTPYKRPTVPNYSEEMPSRSDTTQYFTATNSYAIVDSSINQGRCLSLIIANEDTDGDSLDWQFVWKAAISGTRKDTLYSGTLSPGETFEVSLQKWLPRWYIEVKNTTSDSTALGIVNRSMILY